MVCGKRAMTWYSRLSSRTCGDQFSRIALHESCCVSVYLRSCQCVPVFLQWWLHFGASQLQVWVHTEW